MAVVVVVLWISWVAVSAGVEVVAGAAALAGAGIVAVVVS